MVKTNEQLKKKRTRKKVTLICWCLQRLRYYAKPPPQVVCHYIGLLTIFKNYKPSITHWPRNVVFLSSRWDAINLNLFFSTSHLNELKYWQCLEKKVIVAYWWYSEPPWSILSNGAEESSTSCFLNDMIFLVELMAWLIVNLPDYITRSYTTASPRDIKLGNYYRVSMRLRVHVERGACYTHVDRLRGRMWTLYDWFVELLDLNDTSW